jgi:hypothetical protein
MKTSCKAKVAGFRVKPGMTNKKYERMNNYLSTRFPEEPNNNGAEDSRVRGVKYIPSQGGSSV